MASSDHPEPGTSASNAPGATAGSQPPAAPPPPPARRALRIALWVVAGLTTSLAIGLGSVLWVLAHLDDARVKPRLIALVKDQAGLEIDYEALAVSPSTGVRARTLRLLQPPRFRSVTPDFVRIEDVEIRVDALSWLSHGGPLSIELAHIASVDAAQVQDQDGATTLSELFPPSNEPKKKDEEEPAGLSHALRSLPSLEVKRLAIDALRARQIEVRGSAVERTTSLEQLALAGVVHTEAGSLAGSSIALTSPSADGVRLVQRDGGAEHTAVIDVDVRAQADAPALVALTAQSELRSQTFSPDWSLPKALLALDARASFDEAQKRVSIVCSRLGVLGETVQAEAKVDLYDGAPQRIVASGKAAVALAKLPVPIEGVALDALALTLESKQLSLEGDRIGGRVALTGGLHALSYDRDGTKADLRDVALSGGGSFDVPNGRFDLRGGFPSIALATKDASVKLGDVALTLNGTTQPAPDGAQDLDARLTLTLPKTDADLGTQKLELTSTTLTTRLEGTIAELQKSEVPTIDGKLAIEQVALRQGAERTLLEGPSLAFSSTGLATDEQSPTGVRGNAQLALDLPSLKIVQGGAAPKRADKKKPATGGSTTLTVGRVLVDTALPLTLAEITGALGVESVRTPEQSLEGAQLSYTLAHPLRWADDQRGPASAELEGRVVTLRASGSRAALESLKLNAQRLDEKRYRVDLDADASSLVLPSGPVPEHLIAKLRAEVDRGALKANVHGTLSGARGAALKADLDAAFTRANGRLRYQAALLAEKLEAFAELLRATVPAAAGLSLEGAKLKLDAEGDLAGVVRATPDGLLAPTPDPLSTAHGSQSLKLAIDQVDYREPTRTFVTPGLRLDVASKHEQGAGTAELKLTSQAIRLQEGGTELRLSDLDEQLTARFVRAPDEGFVDVRSKLRVGSLTQSAAPDYRVAGLALDAHVQVDKLRSIFVRELSLENPAAGTTLRASGAIELRTRGSRGDERTLVGREAMALEGKLEQKLEPLEKLGFASRANGTLRIPFRLESGGLIDYRLLASVEAEQVSLVSKDQSLGIEGLTGVIPIIEEFALLEGGPVLSAGPRESPLTEARFFDVHPFLFGDDYLTAQSITLSGLAPLGPFAANVRIDRSDFLIDQLQVGFGGGQVVGQVRASYRNGDPLVRMRLNATGVKSGKSGDVLDANLALSFQPSVMVLDGKVQLVRCSREHLYDILDVVDPFHESTSANRVRQGLKLGYPKFVRFRLHDGALDTKVDLGGVAELVRIDEIRAVPLGPIMQRYLVPTLSGYLKPASAKDVPGEAPVATAAPEVDDAADEEN